MANRVSLDLASEPYHIEVYAGTDNPILFTITRGGVAVDITNHSVKFGALAALGGATKVAVQTNGVGDHFAPASGQTAFTIPKEELVLTAATVEKWVYELRLVESGGDESLPAVGQLIVKPVPGVTAS